MKFTKPIVLSILAPRGSPEKSNIFNDILNLNLIHNFKILQIFNIIWLFYHTDLFRLSLTILQIKF